jgi:riboflavin kinase/FMN adenylyltransferase
MSKSIVTLGTFDGVHRGHQALLRKVIQRARACRARSVVLAFGMPPRHAGEPLVKPVLLTTLPEKLQILKRLGIDHVDVLVFDRKTASTLPEDFFRKTVVEKHGALEMVVGPRVAFGKNRSGRLPLCRRLGKKYGVRIHVVSSIAGGKGVVSSRRIRALLLQGRVESANALLGYPYSVEGKVIHGDHRGRRLGFPTANIDVEPGKILPRGVYWVKVHSASSFPLSAKEALKGADGLCNVGIRPTFTPHAHQLHCEVFLLKKQERLYGRRLRVVFMRRIRAEKRFPNPQALQRQIGKDLAQANLYRKAHFSI